MPAEEHPVGTFPPSEAAPNPEISKLGLAELQELVKWPSKLEAFATKEEPVEPPPAEPEPTTPEPEPLAPEPATEAAAPAAEPDKPAEPSQEDFDRELLKAQVEAMEANSKRLEAKLIGREAGEKGYIKQLQDRIRRLEAGGQDIEPPLPQEPAPDAAPQADGFRTWAVQKASQEAIQGFMESHPDIKEMEQDAASYLQQSGFDARTIYQLDDPISAGREMTRVLEEAYWHVKEQRTRARVAELQTRKADQVRGLEEAKRRAAPSATGSTPTPPTPPKTIRDLSIAELEARVRGLSRR